MTGIDIQIANGTVDGHSVQNSGYCRQVGNAHSNARANAHRIGIHILAVGTVTGSLGIGHDCGILDYGIHHQITAGQFDGFHLATDQRLIVCTDQMNGNGTGNTQITGHETGLGCGRSRKGCRIGAHLDGVCADGIILGLCDICLVVVTGHIHRKACTQRGAGVFHGALCFLGIQSGLEGKLQVRAGGLVALSLEDCGNVNETGVLVFAIIGNVLDVDRGLAREHQRILHQEGIVGQLDHDFDLLAYLAGVDSVRCHGFTGGIFLCGGDPHVGTALRRCIQIQLDVHVFALEHHLDGHIALGHLEAVVVILGAVFLNIALHNGRNGNRLHSIAASHLIGNIGRNEVGDT